MCKGGKGEKSDGKKDKKFTFIRSREAIFKYDGKRGKGARRRGKGERKIINMHLLKAYKARYKSDVKIDGKKDHNMHLLEEWQGCLKCGVLIDRNKG
jgi:hypothetical protein